MAKGIVCPVCESRNHKVIDSRPRDGKLYRRRTCIDCDYRFTTYEMDNEQLFALFEKYFQESLRRFAQAIDVELPVYDNRGRPTNANESSVD